MWCVLPEQIGGTTHGRRHAHFDEGVDHAELRHGEVCRDAPLLPFAPFHPHRVEGGRHAHPGALIRPLTEKLNASVAQVLVGHSSDLRMDDGDEVGRAVDARQRHHNFHGALHARPLGAIQHGLFFIGKIQIVHVLSSSSFSERLMAALSLD